jgi:formamidopyrimidine-DNA glycosylase
MPELPEIETIKRGILPLKNSIVRKIFRSSLKLRIDTTKKLDKIIGSQITSIERRARYLIIDFSNHHSLIIHLGMSGRITVNPNFKNLKHDHFACQFDNQQWLIFNDPRRFGFIDLVASNDLVFHKMLKNLGPEPLSPEFNFEYLKSKIANKNCNIKTTMMDNQIVVGVGNIYINESLFLAKVLPTKLAKNLSSSEIKKLIESIKKIITTAIDMGGSSISDYQNANGELGFFQNQHQVYGRQNQDCYKCGCKIERIVQNQRSTFFCKTCQK